MSEPLRFALVVEGPTETEVIKAALSAILGSRPFVLNTLQPSATRPDLSGGWGGVLKWCRETAKRLRSQPGNSASMPEQDTSDQADACAAVPLSDDPLLAGFDALIIHLDADVASFNYGNLSESMPQEAEAAGWLPLPCIRNFPPDAPDRDALTAVLLSWLRPVVLEQRTVLCLPAVNTGAWLAAAVLPAGHALLPALESDLKLETKLERLPLKFRIRKQRLDVLKHSPAVTQNWLQVTARCTRAQAFDQNLKTLFP